jgi:hypothetical protein
MKELKKIDREEVKKIDDCKQKILKEKKLIKK